MRREGVSALDNLQTLVRALEADETARNAAETDPLMTVLGLPYATIIGKVAGGDWASTVIDRVVAEGRYGVKLGQTLARRRGATCGRASTPPAPRTRSCATIPPTVELTGGKFSSARIPADHPLPIGLARGRRGDARAAARVPRRAVRRGHAAAGQRGPHADA